MDGTVLSNKELLDGTVLFKKELVYGTVPSNKELVDGTLPSNKEFVDGTVPSNSTILFLNNKNYVYLKLKKLCTIENQLPHDMTRLKITIQSRHFMLYKLLHQIKT